ncbi:MAG: GTP-binding protein, partial [Terracidiphilus sp.]
MAVAAELENRRFEIGEFLAQEREKDLLRFSTAGSVDDGKSTLIGRLLYDTQSVYEDQVRSIEGKGTTAPGQIDFALLTDGLRAEREQGITIDVAYRYFSTAKRKFIIADTPGHEQYTRNMATGASTADAAIVLIDASKGVQIQSRRHAYIASLLRVRHVIVAVNKMDLIGYDEAAFRAIEADFREVLSQIAADTGTPVEAHVIPVSALKGDNVVHHAQASSGAMPWYDGPSLLQLLEALPATDRTQDASFRFPVQRVLRPDHTFRGFAGQIASGTVRVGDKITVFPSGREAKIERIVTFDGDFEKAVAPLSVTLVLDREIDISRGDLIAGAGRDGASPDGVRT